MISWVVVNLDAMNGCFWRSSGVMSSALDVTSFGAVVFIAKVVVVVVFMIFFIVVFTMNQASGFFVKASTGKRKAAIWRLALFKTIN